MVTYNKSMEPVIETHEQAKRYMDLTDGNRLIMATTVMPFRFAAAAYRFMAQAEV